MHLTRCAPVGRASLHPPRHFVTQGIRRSYNFVRVLTAAAHAAPNTLRPSPQGRNWANGSCSSNTRSSIIVRVSSPPKTGEYTPATTPNDRALGLWRKAQAVCFDVDCEYSASSSHRCFLKCALDQEPCAQSTTAGVVKSSSSMQWCCCARPHTFTRIYYQHTAHVDRCC